MNIKRIINTGIVVPVILFIIMVLPTKLWANDPSGVVFDSVSNQAIDGATVTLERYITETDKWEVATIGGDIISPTGVTNSQISGWTGAPGEYQFGIALGGYVTKTFRLKVDASSLGYVFPSTLSAAEVLVNCPDRHLGDNTGTAPPAADPEISWGKDFYLDANDNWWIDIPLDPAQQTLTGSSGDDEHKAWYKPQTWKCGCLGLEALFLIFIIGLLRRRYC